MKKRAIAVMVVLMLAILALTCGEEETGAYRFAHSYPHYAQLLERYVDENGWVDYEGIIADSALMRQAINAVGSVSADSLDQFSREEKLAFWINTYNLLTLRAVVDAYPVESIKDIDGVWDEQRYRIGGRRLTLNEIEHDILRGQFNEPRVHFALVCASVSCPGLQPEPYVADSLSAQLRDATLEFLTDPTRNRFSPEFKEAHLSQIFEWYARDFEKIYASNIPKDHPAELRAVLNFVSNALPDSLGRFLLEEGVTVDYMEYDWGLNSQKAARLRPSPSDD